MSDVTILSYLAQRLKQDHFPLPWKLEWQGDNHFIRLTFQFELAKHAINLQESEFWKEQMDDKVYEAYFFIVDKEKIGLGFSHAFYNFAYDPRRGMTVGQLNALVDYLRLLSHRIRSEWMNLAQEGTFDLTFDPREYQTLVDSQFAKGKDNQQVLYFPEKEHVK